MEKKTYKQKMQVVNVNAIRKTLKLRTPDTPATTATTATLAQILSKTSMTSASV
jgi:hypothetical protein